MSESTEERKRREADKPLTPYQILKTWPKAMQVGPQLHLRKTFWGEDKAQNAKS